MANVQLAVAGDDTTQVILSVPGVQGPTGSSIPPSGTTHQLLYKQSSTDYDTGWKLITNDNVDAAAEIAVSKLADGSARQLLQTDAAGTGVEWTSNVDIPGTLDVTSAATFDAAVTTTGLLSASGKISVPLASGEGPSIYFGADTNTGIYSPGADQVAISTNGRQRVAIASDGSLTIGEENITNAVINAPESVFINIDSNNDDTGEAFVVGTNRTSTSGGTELFRIQEDGKVGLGTSSPGFFFDCQGANGTNPVWGYNIANLVDSQTNDSGLRIGSSASTTGICNLVAATNSAASQFGFYTYNGSAWGERIRIDSSGRLGVGTTSPSAALHINADTDATTFPSIILQDSGTTATRLSSITNTSGDLRLAATASLTDLRSFIYLNDDRQIIFGQSNTERARIDSSGTFRVKGAGTAGVNDAVQLNGSAPANSLLLDASGRLLVGTSSSSNPSGTVTATGGFFSTERVTQNINNGASISVTVPTRGLGVCYLVSVSRRQGTADNYQGLYMIHYSGNSTPQAVITITALSGMTVSASTDQITLTNGLGYLTSATISATRIS